MRIVFSANPRRVLLPGGGEQECLLRISRDLRLEDESRAPIVIFSADSNIADAVKRWNTAHPEDQLSLVTITPQELEQK